MASQLPAIRTPFLLLPLRLGRHRGWCVCVCVSVSMCVFVCPTPLWPFSWTRTLPAKREMADCGNDRAVLQCTGLNVKLIFNVWHFTQIIRPQTWPWGIRQIAFSVPQQLWNYSSQRERKGGKKAFEFGEMIALSLLWPSQTGSSLFFSPLWYHDRRTMPNWKHLGTLEVVWNNHILCVV